MSGSLPSKTISPECQVVVFNWRLSSENLSTNDNNNLLSASNPHDISRYITEVSFSKTMDAPAGQFQITLGNDRDWKQHLEKGSWLIIYNSNEGDLSIPRGNKTVPLGSGFGGDFVSLNSLVNQKNKIRCIGFIDTIRAKGTVGDEKGEFDVGYVISGRDFGVVYAETEMWHNQVLFDATLLKTIKAEINSNSIKTVDKLLESIHKLIYSPDQIVRQPLKNDSLSSIARQWLLPRQLFTALGLTPLGDSYFGNIPGVLNFRKTKATYPVEDPTALINGIAWNKLKTYSIEPYHELFAELNDDGKPQLNFRVQPWRITNDFSKFPTLFSTFDKFADEKNGIVEIPNIDILDWDLGEDNHTRYNLFWSTINSSMISIQTSNALIGNNDPTTGFPRLLQSSIKRYGLRKLYSEVNANIVIGTEKADGKLLFEFNELAFELWERSHKYESGTMTIIGNNDVRLGKCVHIEEGSQYNSDKFLYIEGYEESFLIAENGAGEWTQTLFLTRGIEKAVLDDVRLVKVRQSPFVNAGDFTEKD